MPSCYFCTFRDSIMSIPHCADNYVPGLLKVAEMSDVAGLCAPKPLVVVAGEQDDLFPIQGVRKAFEDLREIYLSLDQMNDWGTAYRPILFTIIDGRNSGIPSEDFHFVSVTQNGGKDIDDVNALSFDTARLAIEVWAQLEEGLSPRARRQLSTAGRRQIAFALGQEIF